VLILQRKKQDFDIVTEVVEVSPQIFLWRIYLDETFSWSIQKLDIPRFLHV